MASIVPQNTIEKKLNSIIKQYRDKDNIDGIDPHILIMLRRLEEAELDALVQAKNAIQFRDSLNQATTDVVKANSRKEELIELMKAIIGSDCRTAVEVPKIA